MNKHATILHELSPEQIISLFEGLQNQISDLKQNFEPKIPNEYITRNDLAEMLKVDLSTIHNWCKRGKIVPHNIGNRVYFLRSEIEAKLNPNAPKKEVEK